MQEKMKDNSDRFEILEDDVKINPTDIPEPSNEADLAEKVEKIELSEALESDKPFESEEEKDKDHMKASETKEKGNQLFKAGDYEAALECYSEALRLCPSTPDFEYNRAVYFSNRSACWVHLNKTENAVEDCTFAIELAPKYVKAYNRRAQAYEKLDKLEEALADYTKILEIDPTIRPAALAQQRLKKVVEERQEKMKAEMLSKLKTFGNSILGKFGMSTDNFQMVQDPNTGSYNINYNPSPDKN